LHPTTIELGLERVNLVKNALGLAPAFPVITVGGTNGKGSTCAMLEAVLHAAGYRVGCYTSPHLLRYNERVRIGLEPASDEDLCRAFAAVEDARNGTSLTYFEFGTLAALWLFEQAGIDAAVLEVGLGGRLDAVNVFDADCAVLTSVALDHMDYLGDTPDAIGFEKAGIFRTGRPAICAEPDPPESVVRQAREVGADLQRIGHDFGFVMERNQWRFNGRHRSAVALPYPALAGAYQLGNAAACIAALDELRGRLPVSVNDLRRGLLEATLPGRFQILPGRPAVILDVAHNPHAATALAGNLMAMPVAGRTIAVFAMLADKDIAGVVCAMGEVVDLWFVGGITESRGASVDQIMQVLGGEGLAARAVAGGCVADAFLRACNAAGENDRIVAFGSFYTVADVLRLRGGNSQG
jgi:dihydrofolate synthase/folylpolyglutamate synthase